MALRLEETLSAGVKARPDHPLDPLFPEEIVAASTAVRGRFEPGTDLLFETIDLEEPAKEVVRAHMPGADFPRVARFNAYKRGESGVYRGLVDLVAGKVARMDFLPDARPMISPEEFMMVEAAAKADPRFIAALERRGLADKLDLVCVDPWSAGNFGVPGEENRRLAHTFVWMRMFPLDNYYAHPVEGINVVVDVDQMTVLRVDDWYEDKDHHVPVPTTPCNYDHEILTEYQPHPKPLDIVQPEGPSFTVEGHRISWLGWDLRVGFNGREGLVLHQIGYTKNGKRRPIVYRASIAEMVVPYGSKDNAHHRKNVFDSGEYGFGRLVNSLELGCDCLGHIHYFDVDLSDLSGNVRTIKNAICLHEEDAGLAWKHFDFRTERTEVRRMRKLVISSITTVGNYEYASYWYIYQDGNIEFEMKATGVINTAACIPGQPGKYGTEVAPGVVGQIHQHVFSARLDMEVDGPNNTVVECNTVAPPMGPDSPHGNVFYMEETRLASELAARRNANFDTQRYWKIINPEKKNWVGTPTGYKLLPTSAVKAFTDPRGPSGKRASFMHHHLWVTPFAPDERYPAGEFMNHSTGEEGLPAWTAQDRPVENTDIVLWHSFGLHHLPRLEDHPVQPCVRCGFMLMPTGFFDQNPVIDLPPGKNQASRTNGGERCCSA
ncbi:MAG TPA: primary-amine oxidase [Geminicoccus sp.]|uniref:primary-amine oxidase n=1 Tax=Geminicoccus sp. TaxID=2024832 RepID=UPI002C241128|nr:primary-amine oxidase [Geminicoccus sp.]HWL70833.1 primary-amine oxidase [Geminicoccus sp.]